MDREESHLLICNKQSWHVIHGYTNRFRSNAHDTSEYAAAVALESVGKVQSMEPTKAKSYRALVETQVLESYVA